MRLALPLLLVSLVFWANPVKSVSSTWDFSPLLDCRIRQESLVGAFHFAADPDRNWIRIRSRGGFKAASTNHHFNLRFTNEHRYILHPDGAGSNWDELILDQASWRWDATATTQLTLGRQNIIWDQGFLMLEGHPLDGSRSIYQNALRLSRRHSWGNAEVILLHNPKYDPLVIIDDQDKALSDADETAAGLRVDLGEQKLSLIVKDENDPDNVLPNLQTVTLAARWEGTLGDNTPLMAELALQYQNGATWQGYRDDVISGSPVSTDGFAIACQASVQGDIGARIHATAEVFYYSGGSQLLLPFRAPWGKWPKWSELYIYTLIGESEPGRVHVAAWENIAAPRVTLQHPLGQEISAKVSATYLLAPQPTLTKRGLLLASGLKFQLPGQVQGHLLWEMLDPGDFHDGRFGYAPLTETVHFLRWQLSYAFN